MRPLCSTPAPQKQSRTSRTALELGFVSKCFRRVLPVAITSLLSPLFSRLKSQLLKHLLVPCSPALTILVTLCRTLSLYLGAKTGHGI